MLIFANGQNVETTHHCLHIQSLVIMMLFHCTFARCCLKIIIPVSEDVCLSAVWKWEMQQQAATDGRALGPHQAWYLLIHWYSSQGKLTFETQVDQLHLDFFCFVLILGNLGNLSFIKHALSFDKSDILGNVFWGQATVFSHIVQTVSSLSMRSWTW